MTNDQLDADRNLLLGSSPFHEPAILLVLVLFLDSRFGYWLFGDWLFP